MGRGRLANGALCAEQTENTLGSSLLNCNPKLKYEICHRLAKIY